MWRENESNVLYMCFNMVLNTYLNINVDNGTLEQCNHCLRNHVDWRDSCYDSSMCLYPAICSSYFWRRSSSSCRSVTGMHVKINKEHAKMHVKIKKACENKNKEHAKNVKQKLYLSTFSVLSNHHLAAEFTTYTTFIQNNTTFTTNFISSWQIS